MSMTPVKIRNIYLGDGTPKICIPLTATSRAELSAQASAVLKVPCDMVEWRADYYKPEETFYVSNQGRRRRALCSDRDVSCMESARCREWKCRSCRS